jgi:hypothetical protein
MSYATPSMSYAAPSQSDTPRHPMSYATQYVDTQLKLRKKSSEQIIGRRVCNLVKEKARRLHLFKGGRDQKEN